MTVNVKLNGKIVSVPSGVVKDAVYGILDGTRKINEIRKYISGQGLSEPPYKPRELGYVDFDQLTEDGKPTIVGDFYKKNTVFGLRLSGKLEEVLQRRRKQN